MPNSPVRIGIDGAQSTGKTTLVSELSACLGGRFTYIKEASREVAPDFGIYKAADWDSLLKDPVRLEAFFDAEEAWVAQRELAAPSFIIDSSLWLVAAYRKRYGCRGGINRAIQSHYDLLLHCPPIFAGADDGFRFLTGRSEVDAIYLDLISTSFEGQFITLSNEVGRMRVALQTIEKLVDDLEHRSA